MGDGDAVRSAWRVAVAGLALAAGGAAAAVLGTAEPAAATPEPPENALRVSATDDAYVSSARPSLNFGDSPKLAAGWVSGDTKTVYLKFTVDQVPPSTTVAGAQLTLTTDGGTGAVPLTLERLSTTSWTESTLTGGNAPTLGLPVATVTPAADAPTVQFDLGTTVTGPGVYAFAITSAVTEAVTRFRSSEDGLDGPLLTLRLDRCVLGVKLVPSCHVLWGAAAGGFTTEPRDKALKDWETASGRTATVYHTYHQGDDLFPTPSEIAMASDPQHPRILMTNWKVDWGSTWAAVARGDQDRRIDRLADYLKAKYTDRFFLVLHHEPENDVSTDTRSGMTASDFAAMFRHTVQRLRAKGIHNAVCVVAYMGNERWMAQPWWKDLYPGDDVVDWIGLDSYVNSQPGAYHYGTFATILDRAPATSAEGIYAWAATAHPYVPFMLAEWGVYHSLSRTDDKSRIYNTVLTDLTRHPAVKAMLYFDTPKDDAGDRNISIETSSADLAAFRRVAADRCFTVTPN